MNKEYKSRETIFTYGKEKINSYVSTKGSFQITLYTTKQSKHY